MAMKRKISDWLWLAFLVLQMLGLSLLGSPGCQREEPYNPWGDELSPTFEVEGGVVYDSTEVVLVLTINNDEINNSDVTNTLLVHYIKSEFEFETSDVTPFQTGARVQRRFYVPAKFIKVKEVHRGSFEIAFTDITKGHKGGAYKLEAVYDAVPWRPAAD